jgi:hypothetical protein
MTNKVTVIWHAKCNRCQLDLPFEDKVKRDEWADDHARNNSHHVTTHHREEALKDDHRRGS